MGVENPLYGRLREKRGELVDEHHPVRVSDGAIVHKSRVSPCNSYSRSAL
jgi:hypothetical protein